MLNCYDDDCKFFNFKHVQKKCKGQHVLNNEFTTHVYKYVQYSKNVKCTIKCTNKSKYINVFPAHNEVYGQWSTACTGE